MPDAYLKQGSFIETIAAGIAHEIRNPLNALQINLQILEQEIRERIAESDARVYEVLSKISSELASLDNFVAEFLRFARPPKLKIETVQVRQLLADIVTFLGPQFRDRQVSLRLVVGERCRSVAADSFQLKLAILNLLLNALQATPAGGQVTIDGQSSDDTVLIEIRDTGEGMPAERLDRVFDVFFTTREGGTGLGLPISKRIIDEHGGSIALVSEVGSGTTARIILPIRSAA
jgi:signal transduction histidine kinase